MIFSCAFRKLNWDLLTYQTMYISLKCPKLNQQFYPKNKLKKNTILNKAKNLYQVMHLWRGLLNKFKITIKILILSSVYSRPKILNYGKYYWWVQNKHHMKMDCSSFMLNFLKIILLGLQKLDSWHLYIIATWTNREEYVIVYLIEITLLLSLSSIL